MPEARAKWIIDRLLVKHIEQVLVNPTTRCKALRITPPTWKKIKDQEGIGRNTVNAVVNQFFSIIIGVGDGNPVPEHVLGPIALKVLAMYPVEADTLEFDHFITELKADATVSAIR